MKKIILPALLIVSLGFFSCGSDDDGDGASNCKECDILGFANVKLCEKENNQVEYTVNVAGFGSETDTQELPEDTTFEEFADGVCAGTIDLGN